MNYISAILNSFSQVFLVESRIFGLLIFAYLAFGQPRMGIFSLVGVGISLILSPLLGIKNPTIAAGIMGFNAVLIGVGAAYLFQRNDIALTATLVAVPVAILIQFAAMKYDIPVFTGPFVVMALILFFLKSFLRI